MLLQSGLKNILCNLNVNISFTYVRYSKQVKLQNTWKKHQRIRMFIQYRHSFSWASNHSPTGETCFGQTKISSSTRHAIYDARTYAVCYRLAPGSLETSPQNCPILFFKKICFHVFFMSLFALNVNIDSQCIIFIINGYRSELDSEVDNLPEIYLKSSNSINPEDVLMNTHFYWPMMDNLISSQSLLLSPSQCPASLPLPGNVDREMTIPRFPVASRTPLEITYTFIQFGSLLI